MKAFEQSGILEGRLMDGRERLSLESNFELAFLLHQLYHLDIDILVVFALATLSQEVTLSRAHE